LLQLPRTSTDFDNFGTNVAKKASRQMVLYFPTSPKLCCCTTWGNRKPKIAYFHLNAESCFANRHRKHIHIITWSQLSHPSFSQELDVCTKQDRRSEYSILSSVTTHSSFTKSVLISIAVSKVVDVPCRASSEKSKDVGRISYHLNKCQLLSNASSTTILFAFQQHSSCMHQCMVCATQFNSCCAKLSTSFLLSYSPQQARAKLNYLRDLNVYTSKNMSFKSTKLK